MRIGARGEKLAGGQGLVLGLRSVSVSMEGGAEWRTTTVTKGREGGFRHGVCWYSRSCMCAWGSQIIMGTSSEGQIVGAGDDRRQTVFDHMALQ
jgi:hypothetical protein